MFLAAGALLLLLCCFLCVGITGKLLIGALLVLYMAIFFGFKLSQYSGGYLAGKINNMFIAPKIYRREKAELLTPIEGLMARHRWQEAEQRLREILKKKPHLSVAVIMMGRLCLDHCHDSNTAATVTGNYLFAAGRHRAQPGDAEIVNIHVDARLDQKQRVEALAVLEREIPRPGYPTGERKAMQVRRQALSADSGAAPSAGQLSDIIRAKNHPYRAK